MCEEQRASPKVSQIHVSGQNLLTSWFSRAFDEARLLGKK